MSAYDIIVFVIEFHVGILQIGRLPNEWARCLLPYVKDKKVRVERFCKMLPRI